MAAASAEGPLGMEGFVQSLFQGKPDLSTLTLTIIRKKYLLHTGKKTLTKEEKEQLKDLVEVELMKIDDAPDNQEVPISGNSRGRKRSCRPSDSSGDEVKGRQEQKKQRTGKDIETNSDEDDSGIDSKKLPLRVGSKHAGKSSDCSEQEDSGAEGHTDGSESDGIISKSIRRKPRQRARNEKQKGGKKFQGPGDKRPRGKLGSESEETTEEQQSDSEEEIEEEAKSANGRSSKSESDSEQEIQKRKKFNKEQKQTAAKSENRKVGGQRRKNKNESEEESESFKVGRVQKEKRDDWSESEEEKKGGRCKNREGKAKGRTRKSQEETESEAGSESDSEKRPRGRKNIAISKQKKKSTSIEILDSDSDNSEGKSQMKVTTQKGKTRKVSEEKWSSKSESDSEDESQPKRGGLKRTQKKNVGRKKLVEVQERKKQVMPKGSVSSEDSETDSDKRKRLKQNKKGMLKASCSESESQSEVEEKVKEKGQSWKKTPSSDEYESGPEECETTIQKKKMEWKKKSDSMSESESGQEEKKGAEKSKRDSNTESEADSEDSGRELVKRRQSQGQQKKEKEKPKRRQKEGSENESAEEEEPSSSEEKVNSTSSKQRHQGKDKDSHSGKGEEHPSIRRLKRYIRECGARRNYKKLFEGCRSRKAQEEILKRELENLGMKGAPSLAKCKELKQKREEAAEVASLDLSNIITTEGRPRRRNVWSLYSKPQEPPSSPEEAPIRRPTTDWSSLRGVISSDEESD
ncbi:HIRA-interacting protein 3 [Anolis carolinensis]|uniref:Histone chaperone domain-containing protein n=1 Tax=Anolis carolinensis TaxID=28377 RepID=H9GG27_ANOCA|nr:PREDICTED: HIRA-interacting protein 3 [Anolis carolinensis]|eukprot:XP_003228271.1 PREDICTED: HIRA-interacting protein 3 [Anolis carolinensis]